MLKASSETQEAGGRWGFPVHWGHPDTWVLTNHLGVYTFNFQADKGRETHSD